MLTNIEEAKGRLINMIYRIDEPFKLTIEITEILSHVAMSRSIIHTKENKVQDLLNRVEDAQHYIRWDHLIIVICQLCTFQHVYFSK